MKQRSSEPFCSSNVRMMNVTTCYDVDHCNSNHLFAEPQESQECPFRCKNQQKSSKRQPKRNHWAKQWENNMIWHLSLGTRLLVKKQQVLDFQKFELHLANEILGGMSVNTVRV